MAPGKSGARPRKDTRARILAALTTDPATAIEIAERAGIPGLGRADKAKLVLARLEADGLAIRVPSRQTPRWRAASGALAAL